MSSLLERIKLLESDLLANPLRISAYHDLPFAILHYDPHSEFLARKEAALLATRVMNAGKRVHFISVARILWKAIDETEGVDAIADEERQFGLNRAQETVSTILSDESFVPLSSELEQGMKKMDPAVDVVFLVRTACLGPAIYRCAKLLDEMHGRTMVPIILFYPGSLEGNTNLRFLDLPDREQTGAYNYRVKIY